MGHKVGRISLSFSSLLGQQFGEEGADRISQGMSAPPARALALLLFTSRGVNGDSDRKSERQKKVPRVRERPRRPMRDFQRRLVARPRRTIL